MTSATRKFTAAAALIALCVTTSGALATPPAPVAAPTPVAAASSVDPWLALTAMSSSSSASAAAAQYGDQDGRRSTAFTPLLVILSTVALGIWIVLKNEHGSRDFTRRFVTGVTGVQFGVPVSPN